MALVNYESTSSSEDCEEDFTSDVMYKASEPKAKKFKTCIEEKSKALPDALTLLGRKQPAKAEEIHCDNPMQHGGRVRSFKHERGNWATYVYISVAAELLEDIQELCQCALQDVLPDVHAASDLHISLSRTVVLQYHHIELFNKSLERALMTSSSLNVSLRRLHIYTNEERSRTFIALRLDDIYFEKLQQILCKVDSVMTEYKLPRFYEEPSFHVSFLWCLGDKVNELNEHLDLLKDALNMVNDADILTLFIQEIRCKCGNKEFNFKLQ